MTIAWSCSGNGSEKDWRHLGFSEHQGWLIVVIKEIGQPKLWYVTGLV